MRLKNIWPLIAIAAFAGIGMFFGEAFIDMFAFKKTIVLEFPYYRLVTGHLTHSNVNHYLLNMMGLVVIILLFFEYFSAKNQYILFLVGSISISLLMVFFYEKETYLGMSAYLHFLFAWSVIVDMQSKRKTTYILLAGLIIKIVYELGFYQAGTTEALIGISVATESHAIGSMLGLVAGLITLTLSRQKNRQINNAT